MIKILNYDERGEITIYGDIVSDTEASWLRMMDDGTLGYQYPTKIKEQLDALKGKPIDVHIASDGGDVAAGIAIYNLLKQHDAPVTVYIDSWAASIASVIAFAGSKIVMPENVFLMIHDPKAGAFGGAEYLQSVADWLTKIKDMIANIYVAHSKLSIDEIHELMSAETWFTAREALETFSDIVEVVDATDVKAVASLKTSYKSAPQALSEVVEDVYKNAIIKKLQEAYSYEEES